MSVVVVSTGKAAPTKERCLESVATQSLVALHFYVDAAEQDPPKTVTENLRAVLNACFLSTNPLGFCSCTIKDTDVVVWLDGDDWLAHEHVIERVATVYREHPETWLTYGSFRFADGRPGWAKPYEAEHFEHEPLYYRREDWRGTHLRTFRAGLFRKIKPDDLAFDLAVDQAVMLPMLEMAGAAHARFVPEVLCIYNYASSFEHRAGPLDLARERKAVEAIRRRPPYERLARL